MPGLSLGKPRAALSEGGRRATIGGIPVNVVSEAAAEKADMVVCLLAGSWSPFSDNLTAPCSQCGRDVIFRPTAPGRPAKVCVECAIPLAQPAAGTA